MSILHTNAWANIEHLQKVLSYDKTIKSISAIRSYIEADEANLLLEATNNNYKAKIFALMCCFTYIPSIKCIEHLIADGTPLNKSFDNNPYECTPQEYLDRHFGFTNNKIHSKARTNIYNAIEKGKLRKKNNEHVAITVDSYTTGIKESALKKMGKMLLSPLSKH
jgi:hypothetical protein